MESVRVEPTAKIDDVPVAVYQRDPVTAEIRVLLQARGRLWAQFVFQFAHELFHAMATLRPVAPPVESPSFWIQESLAEASSLFALRSMAQRWSTDPPFPNWSSFAPSLRKYADDRMNETRAQAPPDGAFVGWLTERLPELDRNPCRREDNLVVALRLLPVLEEDPNAWRAIRYLNRWDISAAIQTADFFDAWRSVAPPLYHAAITRLESSLRD